MSGTNSSINNTLKLPLKGLVTSTNSAITSTDRVIDAFGKLQAQITSVNTGTGKLSATQTWSGVNTFSAATNSFSNLLGIATVAPTHSFTLGSTSTGWTHYNTSDQTTNFERVRGFWDGNVYNIASEKGGTGIVRDIQLTGKIGVNITPSSNTLDINTAAISNGGIRLLHSAGTPFATLRIKNVGVSNSTQFGTISNNDLEFLTNSNIVGAIFPTGNWFLGSSPVDSGFRLDVNGSARVQGNITGTGKLFFTTNTVFSSNPLVGVISKQSDHGLILAGATGTINDFALGTPSGQLLLVNPTGTNNISFAPASGGNVLIGTTTNVPSSLLTLASTTKGFLPPRGTNTQMNAIVSPAEGLVFFDSTNKKLNIFNGTTWEALH